MYIHLHITQSAGAVEYDDWISAEGKTPPLIKECFLYHTKVWWGSIPRALGNVVYSFIAITHISTLTR